MGKYSFSSKLVSVTPVKDGYDIITSKNAIGPKRVGDPVVKRELLPVERDGSFGKRRELRPGKKSR
jgi:hypothetical protein